MSGLLDEEAFAKLIAPNKHFGSAIPGEQIRYFPVLKNALRLERTGCRNQFQVLSVQHAVAMEDLRFPRVEDGENYSSIAHERRNARGEFGHEVAIEIIQNVPQEHGIEGVIGIKHCRIQKPLRAPFRGQLGSIRPNGKFLRPQLFLDKEILPGGQQILGVDLKAPVDEESDCGLPSRPKIQQMSVANSIELPEKFLEAIGLAPILRCNAGGSGSCTGRDGHGCSGMGLPWRRMPLRQ